MNQPFWIGGGLFSTPLRYDLFRIRNWRCLAKMTRSGPFITGTNEYRPIPTPRQSMHPLFSSPNLVAVVPMRAIFTYRNHVVNHLCQGSRRAKASWSCSTSENTGLCCETKRWIEQPEMMKYPRKKYLKKSPHKWRLFHGKAWNDLASPKKI